MKRLPLNKDDVVQMNSRLYTIESVIGDGATCIVYSAYYRDRLGRKHRVNLKECYPYSANIVREQQALTWNAEKERDQWLDSFQNAYEKLMTWQNAYDTVNVFDLCEANNTLYIIMNADNGKTFDKEQPESLRDILNTVKLLAHSVGRYHENGYLHLDVKPSNFLVYPRPIEHIVLFDLDSVTSMDDIRAGKMRGVSYSDGWAAPEQKQSKISRLCPATDIFAIGAILFEKVMGRQVEASDMGVFADWNFEGELFEDVNPKIKRLLREIFHKTLAANIKRRYQTTEALEEAIEKALGACGSPFLQSPDLSDSCFVGREQELNQISEAFEAGAHLVALKGIGGIGKSKIAKRYACLHEGDYDAVVYCQYKGAISDLLGEIEIHNFEGDSKSHQKQLHLLLDKEVLLIVDGFDSDSDPDFSELERLKCRVLITSQLDWEEYSIPAIKIEAMPVENQVELFLKEFGGTLDTNQEQVVLEILKLTEGYTLLIPLLAKQLRKGVSGFEETLMNLRSAGIKGASAGKVRQLKDGMPMSGTVYGILSQVLNMAGFSEDEVYIMRSLALLSQYRIDQKEFINWVGKEYLEQIDDLVFTGWILREEIRGIRKLSMHSVISNLCFEELKPSITNCYGIRDRIWDFATDFAQFHKDPLVKYFGGYAPTVVQPNVQYQFDAFTDMMSDILVRSDWNSGEEVIYWIRTISKVSNVIYGDNSKFRPFLEWLLDIAIDVQDLALPYLSEAALALETISLQEDDLDSALSYAKIAVCTLDSVTNTDEIVFRLCFNFYQYVCCKYSGFEEYWTAPGFREMASFARNLWQDVVENDRIEDSDHDVGVLSKGDCSVTTGEAIAQAYEDFCWKISEEGIRYAAELMNDSEEDTSDLIAMANRAADIALELRGIELPETSHIDTAERLTEEEFELGVEASNLEKQVNAMLRCNVGSIRGVRVVVKPPVWTDDEKRLIQEQLQQMDSMIPYHEPSLEGRTTFVYKLAKMEAAFSYAYANVGDWTQYAFHVSNLLKYYKVIIFGKRNNSLFRKLSISEINSGLPGAASLLNQYGMVLPPQQALEFIIEIIKIMEEYHRVEHLSVESLFEVYEMALDFAKGANDSSAITHFENRIKVLSSVHFSRKD